MRYASLLLIITLLASPAISDPTDLLSGVFIAHHPPDYTYSTDQDWCAMYYSEYVITDASQQVPRTDYLSSPNEPDTWYILVGFDEDKEWCAAQFGLGNYNEDVFYMQGSDCGICLNNGIETPDQNWPGPNTGIYLVSTSDTWAGNCIPIYYFQGYTYLAYQHSDYTSTIIPITRHPIQGGVLGLANCEVAWAYLQTDFISSQETTTSLERVVAGMVNALSLYQIIARAPCIPITSAIPTPAQVESHQLRRNRGVRSKRSTDSREIPMSFVENPANIIYLVCY
jgi:hypothetical protein